MRLKELAEDLKNQRQDQKEVSDKAGMSGSSNLEGNDPALKRCDQEKLDEM